MDTGRMSEGTGGSPGLSSSVSDKERSGQFRLRLPRPVSRIAQRPVAHDCPEAKTAANFDHLARFETRPSPATDGTAWTQKSDPPHRDSYSASRASRPPLKRHRNSFLASFFHRLSGRFSYAGETAEAAPWPSPSPQPGLSDLQDGPNTTAFMIRPGISVNRPAITSAPRNI